MNSNYFKNRLWPDCGLTIYWGIQATNEVTMIPFKYVSVPIHDGSYLTMIYQSLDIFRVSFLLNEMRRIDMPQIVEPDSPILCLLQCLIE
jgi:hypothetical protein